MRSPKTPWILFTLITMLVLSAAIALSIVVSVRPSDASPLLKLVLLTALFIFLTEGVGTVWHVVRKKFNKLRIQTTSYWVSLRQGALFSIVFILSLYLSSLNVLSAWDIVALTVAAILIEFFFQAEKTFFQKKSLIHE